MRVGEKVYFRKFETQSETVSVADFETSYYKKKKKKKKRIAEKDTKM